MKKILALILAAMMLLLTAVACAPADDDTNAGDTTEATETTTEATEETTEAPAAELAYGSALELLTQVLDGYNATASEETKLYVAGGNINNFDTTSMDGPAKFVPLADSDYTDNLGYPEAEASKIDDAASMFNMMNVNVFNCYTLHFTEGTDVDATIESLKANILAKQWVCGAPEKLVIVKIPGDYILAVWGAVQFGGVVDPFVASISSSVAGAEIVVEHSFEA